MANIIYRGEKPVAITCPVCGKNRAIGEYVASHDSNGTSWYDKCERCRKDEWVLAYVNKPDDKGWDDIAMDPCVPHRGVCRGGNWTDRFDNGKPIFRGHKCVQCNGTGKQTYRDILRNASYNEWEAYKACMSDEAANESASMDQHPDHQDEEPESMLDLGCDLGSPF